MHPFDVEEHRLETSWGDKYSVTEIMRAYEDSRYWVHLLAGKLERSTGSSAGYDLFCNEDSALLPSRGRRLIRTGVVTQFSPELVGLILDKSGLATRQGLTRFAGVIDGDYDQEWGVLLYNTGELSHRFVRGDKVAQVVWVPRPRIKFTVSDGAELIESRRSRVGGFGSTGGRSESEQPSQNAPAGPGTVPGDQ